MRIFFAFIVLAAVVMIPLHAGATTANTIDELAAMYSTEKCADCHEDIHKEWKDSWHSKSLTDPRVLRTWRTFIKSGLDKSSAAKRRDLKDVCLPCHVPQTKDASDELVVQISDLIVTAVDGKDTAKREAANKELAKLNINCLVCHNMKGSPDGKPREKTIYGPGTAADVSAHKDEMGYDTVKSDLLKNPKFCEGYLGLNNWDITAMKHFDLGIEPYETDSNTFVIPLKEGTKSVEIEAAFSYLYEPGRSAVINKTTQKVDFKK